MDITQVTQKIKILNKMIGESSGKCPDESLTRLILLSAMSEMKLRKYVSGDMIEIAKKIDDAMTEVKTLISNK